MTVRSTERLEMSTAVQAAQDEMQTAIKRLAFPSASGESVKSCQRRVLAKVNDFLTERQVRALWAKEWKHIPLWVGDELRRRVEAHEQEINNRIAALRGRNAALYALIHHSSDPEFFGGQPGVAVGETDERG